MSPPKNRLSALQIQYLIVFIPLVVGCKDEHIRPIAHISVDKLSSAYDRSTDSTTTTHIAIELQDSSPFWQSIIDSIPQASAIKQTRPIFSFDTIIKIKTSPHNSLTIMYGSSWGSSLTSILCDSAEIKFTCCSISTPVLDAIREHIRSVIINSPHIEDVYQSPGNTTISPTAATNDSVLNISDCPQDKIDSCIAYDTRIYPPSILRKQERN